MSMSASSKKSIFVSLFSESDRSRLVTEHATRALAAEKVFDASKHIITSNPEPTNISDRHKLLSDESKMKVIRAEGCNLF